MLLSKTTLARNSRDFCCGAMALVVDLEAVARVKEHCLSVHLQRAKARGKKANGIKVSYWRQRSSSMILREPNTSRCCLLLERKLQSLFYFILFIFKIYLFLFWAALGLHCRTQAFSSCGEWGLLFVVLHGLLIVVASLFAEHGL